jgi:uncharacterized protein with PQ loop repeat
MLIFGVLVFLLGFPKQAKSIEVNRSVRGVSLFLVVATYGACFIWFWYGVRTGQWKELVVSNGFALPASIFLLSRFRVYGPWSAAKKAVGTAIFVCGTLVLALFVITHWDLPSVMAIWAPRANHLCLAAMIWQVWLQKEDPQGFDVLRALFQFLAFFAGFGYGVAAGNEALIEGNALLTVFTFIILSRGLHARWRA